MLPDLLQLLPILQLCFSNYCNNFTTNLPETKEGYNTLMIITQCLVKGIQFIPCCMGNNELSAVRVAELFFKHVVGKSGILDEIVSDHDHRLQKLKSLTSLK